MSRSYRKPWSVDGYGTKRKVYHKRQANRRVRNTESIPNGKAYRRIYNPWEISDYRFLNDFEPWVMKNFHTGELEWVSIDFPWQYYRK